MRRIWVTPLVDELTRELRGAHAGRIQSLGPERCRRLLTDAIETARRHDLTASDGLRAYAALVITVGEDLGRGDAVAWSGPVLDDPWLTRAEKIERLERLAVEQGLIHP